MRSAVLAMVLLAGCSARKPALDYSALTVDDLRAKLTDTDPNVRWAAVFEIEHRNGGALAAVKELTVCLGDEHVQVRAVTTQALGSMLTDIKPPYDPPVQQAIDALRDAQDDASELVRTGVRIALMSVVEGRMNQ